LVASMSETPPDESGGLKCLPVGKPFKA